MFILLSDGGYFYKWEWLRNNCKDLTEHILHLPNQNIQVHSLWVDTKHDSQCNIFERLIIT